MTNESLLDAGCAILELALAPRGFRRVAEVSGTGSGGAYARTSYWRGTWRLEKHVRGALAVVVYHLGSTRPLHAEYMRAVMAPGSRSAYPGFDDDKLEGFRALTHDLEVYGVAFLPSDESAFLQAVD